MQKLGMRLQTDFPLLLFKSDEKERKKEEEKDRMKPFLTFFRNSAFDEKGATEQIKEKQTQSFLGRKLKSGITEYGTNFL